MGKIKDYTVGSVKSTDLVTVSDGDTGETKNVYAGDLLDQGAVVQADVYRVKATQAGTDAPVMTELGSQNTIGAIVWARTLTGRYTGTLTGAFDGNPVIIFGAMSDPTRLAIGYFSSADVVNVRTYSNGIASDDILYDTFIEIRNYGL